MRQAFTNFLQVMQSVSNPMPLLLDRAGLMRKPYVVQTVDGLKCQLRPSQSDRYIFFEMLVERLHMARGQRLSAGNAVLDVGANIGCFSMLAAQLVGPSGKVVAIEPEPGNFECLSDNVHRNGFKNVSLIPAALGGKSGTIQLRTGAKASFSSTLPRVDHRELSETVREVPLMTVEQVLNQSGIDRCHLMKVDCEGAEYDIFLNMPEAVAKRIDQISLETHYIDGHRPPEMVDRLKQLGYSVYVDSSLVLGSRLR